MNKYLKDEIDRKYNEIFKDLCIKWIKELDKEYETLVTKGLNTSGCAVGYMYTVIEKIVDETIGNLDDSVKEIDKEFGGMPLKEIKNYIENSKKDLDGHIDSMKEKVLEKFNGDKLINDESNLLRINNIKGNAISKLNQMYLRNRNIKRFRRVEWLVIINTTATVGSLIIAMVSIFI